MSTRLFRSGLSVLFAAGLAAVAGCGSAASGLDGSIDLGSWAGVVILPGKIADYTGFLGNYSGQAVVLESARLLTLKGFRAPRLVRVGIEPYRGFIASDRDWPPDNYPHPVLSLAGFRLHTGRRAQILYGVVTPRTGEYGDAGIQVTVVVGGATVTVNVLSAAGTCVRHSLSVDCPNSFYNRISNVSNVPGGGVVAVTGPVVR